MSALKKKTSTKTPDFRRIFESVPGLCLVLDNHFTILSASDAYLHTIMKKRDEVIGFSIFDIFPQNADISHTESIHNLRTSLEQVLKHGKIQDMLTQKYHVCRPDSATCIMDERFLSPHNAPVLGDNGDVDYIIHCVMDVTDFIHLRHENTQSAKHAEHISEALDTTSKELVKSRTFLKNIINTTVDPIFVKDRQHRIIEGNDALWELFGRSEKEVIGKSDYDFFPKEEADVFWQKDEEVFNSGKANVNIENFTDAEGNKHIISTKKSCFSNTDGEKVLVGIIRDITDIITANNKLKESDEARLKAIMDHSGCAVYIKDLEGKYLRANRDLLELMELTEDKVIGKTDHAFFPAEFADVFRMNDLQVIQNAAAIEFEEKAPHRDGVHIYHSVKFPLYDPSGKLYALCGLSRDVTERKNVEAQLLHYTWELERSNQELDDFAYIASHDLKEPLRGVYNHASFLLEDYGDTLNDDAVHRLKRLSTLAQRMEQLINDLLYFSRLGRTELAIQETNPNSMIEEIRHMLDSFMQEHNAHIIINDPMPNIICDKPRIAEVFRNLITNAIKYNDKDKRIIEVGWLAEIMHDNVKETNVFYVKDNGIGISKEFHQDIFRIFKRLQTEDKESGTGVGLTFVKKIIERHNGHIWLESDLGTGTTVYFTIGEK